MTRVWTAALVGVQGALVEVEVRISSQLPRVDVVGLPEAAVRESVSRIRGALAAGGFDFPDRRITINLAPAELRKNGAGLDLPIAIGILAASDVLPTQAIEGRAFLGELALDGRLRSTRGTLAAVLAIRDAGVREVFVPRASVERAQQAPRVEVLGAESLAAVVSHLLGIEALSPSSAERNPPCDRADAAECLSDIRGQAEAKRALEIAAAGEHGLLLSGPPGTGKTLLAKRLPSLLPALGDEERIESLSILDAADKLAPGAEICGRPPFRSPHHSASAAGLLGGGHPIQPGEVSLAHHGVLFLDELPEFNRRCLESLREVLEQGVVRIARANDRCEMPARIQLIAAANPCPCGSFGTPDRDCRCDEAALARYRRRLSGPLLDRIDLGVVVQNVPWSVLRGPAEGPTTAEVRARVERARALQLERSGSSNARIPDGQLDAAIRADDSALALLGRAVDARGLSARAARRVMRVARTIADLKGAPDTTRHAIAEALALRRAL